MKKLFILLLILSFVMTMLFACNFSGGGNGQNDPPDVNQGGTPGEGEGGGTPDGGDEVEPTVLPTPTVNISKSGLATWTRISGATGYKVIVGIDEYTVTVNSMQLEDGDIITVSALGDGVKTLDSEFSSLVVYNAPIVVNPDTPTDIEISDLGSASYNKAYTVRGIVCAAGNANLMLTDNSGNYVYVYTEQPHGYTVGDEIELTGTKAEYWNVYEIKDVTESKLISSDNKIDTPFVTEGDGDFFEDRLTDFTVGEYVTVTGRLKISGNYYNFEIDGLDGAMLSLAYGGEPLKDGELYTATGYLAFVSGSSAKYINIIVTEIEVYSEGDPEPALLCEVCGESTLIGDHSELDCGHYACEGGEHELLDCKHYACEGGEHVLLSCGHYACEGGEHSLLACGEHYACEGGDHGMLPCGHYACFGIDHTLLPCGHYECSGGDHSMLACRHYACEGGDHTPCEYCGNHICLGDHSSCGEEEIEYCEICGEDISEGDHSELVCGEHYACEGGEHGLLGCMHFACEVGDHVLLSCGHYACLGGDHELLACNHHACESGDHSRCIYCGDYNCSDKDHSLLVCGHFACQDGDHVLLSCGHYACEGGDHTLYGCGHCASTPGGHFECERCGKYLCTGDHLSCGEPVINYCNICGKNFDIGDHTALACGHYACEEGNHEQCPFCTGYLCTGEHHYRECGHPVCTDHNANHELCPSCGNYSCFGNHEALDCGHNACLGGEHRECMRCLGYVCIGDHSALDCGHLACEVGEHRLCSACSGYLCFGTHEMLDCGHLSCESCEGMLCPYCGEYLCNGEDHTACGEEETQYCEICGGSLDEGEHSLLPCGEHYACEGGDHGMLPCGHYACFGIDHTLLPCGHYECRGGDHSMLACRHYACEGGDHTPCEYCGDHICLGDHSSCGEEEIEYCEICGEDISEGDHSELECGHYACLGGDHELLGCKHFACEDGDHVLLSCGHYACLGGEHKLLDCGHYSCDGGEHSVCEICEEPVCSGEHGEGLCVRLSSFPEVKADESDQLHCIEGIVCAVNAAELLVTDNEGNYFYMYVEEHPYKEGDKVRAVGYSVAFGNTSYEFVIEKIELLSSDNELVLSEPKTVTEEYFIDGGENGYFMGDYVRFDGYLDQSTDCFVLGDIYVSVSWVDHEIYYGESYTVTVYVLYLNAEGAYFVIATDFDTGSGDESGGGGGSGDVVKYCPVCGGNMLYGDHSLLDCGHYACEGGDHDTCSFCGGYLCDGKEHGQCYACRGSICDGKQHDLCNYCGWYLCKGNHSLLECGHRACEGGEHYRCSVCGDYICKGGDHYELDCGHPICDGGIHKTCPACYEHTCNAPDHPLCKLCNDYTCVGVHKSCPACGKVTCNKPDHPICPECGNYRCVCDCEIEITEYITEFHYNVSYQECEEKVYCENDDPSRPMLRLISYKYKASINCLVSFAPKDDNTFVVQAFIAGTDPDTGLEIRLVIFEFTGICSRMDDGDYAIEVTTFTNIDGDDYMQYHGTFFPKTRIAVVHVDDASMSFEVPEMLAFVIADKGIAPELYKPCYYCGNDVLPGNVHLHLNTCTICGKQFCEGGVEAHYFYNDINPDPFYGPYGEHLPVDPEDCRTALLTRVEIDINNGGVEITTPMAKKKEDEITGPFSK